MLLGACRKSGGVIEKDSEKKWHAVFGKVKKIAETDCPPPLLPLPSNQIHSTLPWLLQHHPPKTLSMTLTSQSTTSNQSAASNCLPYSVDQHSARTPACNDGLPATSASTFPAYCDSNHSQVDFCSSLRISLSFCASKVQSSLCV